MNATLPHIGRSFRSTPVPVETPWGPSQSKDIYTEGVDFYATCSHGGFHLDAAHNSRVHPAWRNDGGWYEEDVAWAIVAITYSGLFSATENERAHAIAIAYMPDAYEKAAGKKIPDGASAQREDDKFLAAHADRYIVRSAIFSRHNPGFVECVATLGGGATKARRFLVPNAEYERRGRHFAIDRTRHAEYAGVSSFVGLRHAF